jgi:2-dehydro-3-deoxyphosphogluconate aldolase/(4S)-4-hydroxy-2-oxoglutarate aldolase
MSNLTNTSLTDTRLTVHQVMTDAPVIPVIVLNQVAHAVPLAQALAAGGIRMLEITLRTPQALDCMREITASGAENTGGAVVGAGTVRNAREAEAAVKAGAKFLVSPGYTTELGAAAKSLGVPLLPGVATSSEIMTVLQDGLTAAKFFPAVQAGGIPMLKAFAGPFGDLKFCPTGGITPENAADFLALPNVACVGGSWLVPQKAMEQGDWAQITALAKTAHGLR